MPECLCSVGLDVGTTTTQLIVSRIRVRNQASSFAVPRMEITEREVVYQSPVYFTPLLDAARVDGEKLRAIVEKEYERAGIRPEDVDTGAVIVTGETSRKENARTVLEALSRFAGGFVVATAGPDLESVLAAKGAGAVAWSEKTGRSVLHMDIGGGTCNLARIEEGRIVATGCMNVGGRLVKLRSGCVSYISPALEGLTELQTGDQPDRERLYQLAQMLTQALEMAAGLLPPTALYKKLSTREASGTWECKPAEVISFSGGVADCIGQKLAEDAYGDIGPLLGQAIRNSRLCRGTYMLADQTIRATVIGAGCHSAQLSGSTVFYRNIALPLQNLPVAVFDEMTQEDAGYIRAQLGTFDEDTVVLAIPGYAAPSYGQVQKLAKTLCAVTDKKLLIALEQDMAKALGHSLCLHRPDMPLLCIDRVQITQGSYLDIGAPVGPCLPVVVKTLILSQ